MSEETSEPSEAATKEPGVDVSNLYGLRMASFYDIISYRIVSQADCKQASSQAGRYYHGPVVDLNSAARARVLSSPSLSFYSFSNLEMSKSEDT